MARRTEDGAARRIRDVEVHETSAVAETMDVATALARTLRAGSVVGLQGDLGTGKTHFAKGLARGLGFDPNVVLSPTFTFVNVHRAAHAEDASGGGAPGRGLGFVHVDLYRIGDPSDLSELGLEELPGPQAIAAIEWPERLGGSRAIDVLVRLVDRGGSERRIEIERVAASAVSPAPSHGGAPSSSASRDEADRSAPAPTPVPGVYAAVRWLARRLVLAYYPDLVVEGAERVPAGPLIVAANHPNGIVDPVAIAAFLPRRISWLAKATLFDHGLARWALRTLGAIPVKRRHEGGDAASTSMSLGAAAHAIRAGEAVGIFPEGRTHDELRIQELKTGVGRLAVLVASELPTGERVTIVPVSLHFPEKTRFRSDAVLEVGEAIAVARDDDPAAVTQAVRSGLARLVVHVDDAEQERLLAGVRVLLRRQAALRDGAGDSQARHRLDVEVSRAVRRFVKDEPARVQAFAERLAAYLERLERHGLTLRSLEPVRRHPARVIAAVAALPIALYGLAHSWLPFRATGWIAEAIPRPGDRTTIASIAIGVGAIVFSVTWIVETLIVGSLLGAGAAVLFLLTVAPTALVARWSLHVLWRVIARRRDEARLRHEPNVVRTLREERAWIWAELERWRQLHLAESAPSAQGSREEEP